MTTKTYTRLELAKNQLETAIILFLREEDLFSVITLAGAADVILTRLVSNKGEENFTEYSMRQHDAGPSSSREEYGKTMNDTLFINHLKHMDKGEDGFIELDPYDCALGAILKALANYKVFVGQDNLVLGFLAWVRKNLDPKKYNVNCDPDWRPTVDDGATPIP